MSPGKNTFPITRKLLAGVLVVTDAEVRHAMRTPASCADACALAATLCAYVRS